MTEQLNNYLVENLFFHNMDEEDMFKLRNELTLEEKISFIDKMENSFATKLLHLMDLWIAEKEDLPKQGLNPKTVSIRAWIKRNTKDFHININEHLKFWFLSKEFYVSDFKENNENTIHKCFSVLCQKLKNEEYKYFRKNNSFYIKLEQIKEYHNRYGALCNTVSDIYWNGYEDFTEQQLNAILESYSRIIPVFNEETEKLKEYFNEKE